MEESSEELEKIVDTLNKIGMTIDDHLLDIKNELAELNSKLEQ